MGNTLNAKIKALVKTTEEWVSARVLDDREIGYDSDKKVFKIGDGETSWADLPEWGGDASSLNLTNGTEEGSLKSTGAAVVSSGLYSVAFGVGTRATGNYSYAEGGGSLAEGISAHAEGGSTKALGQVSHAEGGGATASGVASHAEGASTIASGNYSHAEGGGTEASGEHSHTEGSGTAASEANSHAEGQSTTASGKGTHAEGCGTIASNDYAHAEGYSTTASGINSHAEGGGSVASGNYSHAEGGGTEASGFYSHAAGWGTIAPDTGVTAIGTYNDTTKSALFYVGNGEDKEHRSNALTLTKDGKLDVAGGYSVNGQDLQVNKITYDEGGDLLNILTPAVTPGYDEITIYRTANNSDVIDFKTSYQIKKNVSKISLNSNGQLVWSGNGRDISEIGNATYNRGHFCSWYFKNQGGSLTIIRWIYGAADKVYSSLTYYTAPINNPNSRTQFNTGTSWYAPNYFAFDGITFAITNDQPSSTGCTFNTDIFEKSYLSPTLGMDSAGDITLINLNKMPYALVDTKARTDISTLKTSKQDKLTAGEDITISDDNVISVDEKEITLEEYRALTPEEQNNGTYYITDATLSDNKIDTAGTIKPYVYSEEETVVGVYDGKPLYRKIVNMSNPIETSGGGSYPHNIENIDTIVNYRIYGILRSGSIVANYISISEINTNPSMIISSETFATYGMSEINIAFAMGTNFGTGGSHPIQHIRLIAEYTKTTDAAGSGDKLMPYGYVGGNAIDDSVVSAEKTWSSAKIKSIQKNDLSFGSVDIQPNSSKTFSGLWYVPCILFSPSIGATCMARLTDHGSPVALIGSWPSDVKFEHIGGDLFKITNNVKWTLTFTFLGKVELVTS